MFGGSGVSAGGWESAQRLKKMVSIYIFTGGNGWQKKKKEEGAKTGKKGGFIRKKSERKDLPRRGSFLQR